MKGSKSKKAVTPLEKETRRSLTLVYSLIFFLNLLITLALITTVLNILIHNGVIFVLDEYKLEGTNLLVTAAIISLVLGSLLAFATSRIILRPFNRSISAINRLAAGDFKARLSFSKGLMRLPAVKELTESFNKMAEELENTEMLRADFINNFSHEFKTPIVSITGFAKLLRYADLTEEEREQYLAAIEEESMRLSGMATNVLSLTRIENQAILTDRTDFNVSEQIRRCVLMLEEKWTAKRLLLDVDLAEHTVNASEPLLSEVWLNLIDNAVKYTPDGGRIGISAIEDVTHLTFVFENSGITIPKESIDKIWNKFYQADESHSTQGNGVGLAIVRRVVELHGGTVGCESGGGVTRFFIKLPK